MHFIVLIYIVVFSERGSHIMKAEMNILEMKADTSNDKLADTPSSQLLGQWTGAARCGISKCMLHTPNHRPRSQKKSQAHPASEKQFQDLGSRNKLYAPVAKQIIVKGRVVK